MTTALIEKVGAALHGNATWKHALARDLRIPLRMFRRMAAGEERIPPGVWTDLKGLLLAHSLGCRDLAVEIGGLSRPPPQVIRHKDGDYRNNDIRNVEIVTLAPDAGEGEV